MTRARVVGRAIIAMGVVASFVLAFVVDGGARHLPWVIVFSLLIAGLLWWSSRRGYRDLDAGEEVFLAVLIVFVSMLVWARVGS